MTWHARQHLKDALELASKAQDNYLRAVVLALVAAHYLHTASEHAFSMLQTCEQLAAGLGAPAAKGNSSEPTGHLRLGLWVGQKYLGTCISLRTVHGPCIDVRAHQSCTEERGKMRARRNSS